jgi:Flp pilus assembly secretin CpaC/tetratricopeptide (TPR) repeat protein
VRTRELHASLRAKPAFRRWTRFCAAQLLLASLPGASLAWAADSPAQSPAAQNAATTAVPSESQASTAKPAQNAERVQGALPTKPVRNSDRRRAAKLYLAASKLFERELFEEAMRDYERAATLDPGNADYPLAASVARNHLVMALIQAAAKDRMRGDEPAARAALAHALELDPKNLQVSQHLYELGDDALLGQSKPLYEQGAETAGEGTELAPASGVHSFHLHTSQRQIFDPVFKSYGIQATMDESVPALPARLDVENASFETVARLLELVTKAFYVPLDAHRVLVVRDTAENRQRFLRLELETIYLPGLSSTELTDVSNLAKNVFDAQQAVADATSGTITIRAPEKTLNAFNATMRELLDGRSQVLLDVRMIELAHTNARNTGAQLPQSMGVFNVAAEAESVFNANQSAIQQIISSGLAAPTDFMAILAILVASGQVTNSPLTSGFATFGGSLTNCTNGVFSCSGALTTFGLAPGTTTANLNLNSSESRELDQIQLRLGDGEAATLRSGMKYPIQTSSYSSLGASASSIAGLTGAGNSSSLSSLLASYASSVPNIPQVEYQDLGLTLKATPKVMRNDEVALTIDMKIDALAGTSINGNPILNNRAYSGVVTLKQGEAVVVVSDMDKSESRSVSGMPGFSEIPGMNDLTDKDTAKDYATLLIVMTPHVVRGIQAAGHSPMMRIERGQKAR